ncbi:hypothetical protein A1351_23035 [Methylosinus sp. R-45379]|uniref:hypothetical protein n=1 Tax=Methylosinus sp. R-45379 TaxID=980563 RepID=UPI0007C94BC6|nr:hypothetical protein [Methylosinus sp. R-45379]OAI30369.1 hypothetical protein A1351_23035 [Methylosinus sp. R-45379]
MSEPADSRDAVEIIASYHLVNGLFAPDRTAFERIIAATGAPLGAEVAGDVDRLFSVFDYCMRRASGLTFTQPARKAHPAAKAAIERASNAVSELSVTLACLNPSDTVDARFLDMCITRIAKELSNIRSILDARHGHLEWATEERRLWRDRREARGYARACGEMDIPDSIGLDIKKRADTEFHQCVLSIVAGFYELAFEPNTVPTNPRSGPFVRFVTACYAEMRAVVETLRPPEGARAEVSKVKDDALGKWEPMPDQTIRSRMNEPREARKMARPWWDEPPEAQQHRALWEMARDRWQAREG